MLKTKGKLEQQYSEYIVFVLYLVLRMLSLLVIFGTNWRIGCVNAILFYKVCFTCILLFQ